MMTFGPRWSAILVGAVLCLAIQITLALLGSGIGLFSFSVEEGASVSAPGAVALALTGTVIVALAFFAGGYAASFLARTPERGQAVAHGLCVWAVVTTFVAIVIGGQAASAMGGLFTHAGVGAGAAEGSTALLKQLSKMKLHIDGDLKVLKGELQADAYLSNPPPANVGKATVRETKKDVARLGRELEHNARGTRDTVQDVRHAAAGASLAACGALVLGALASALGALAGRRPPPRDTGAALPGVPERAAA